MTPQPQTSDAIGVSRWLLHAVGFAGGTLAGMVALALVVSLGSAPVLRNAVGAVDVHLGLPEDTSLPFLDQRSIVYASDGSVLAVLHEEVDRRLVTLDEIPDHVRQAVLTAEDRKFYEHEGYDVEGIGRALLANVRARGIAQGGSTITQQLAKQNFVGGDQTLERKVSELLYAIALEEQFSKDELLERYLNQVYFGAGSYGVASAAEEFFRTPPERLEVVQAALLAGLIRAPGRLDPRRNPDAATARRNAVLAGMAREGYIDSAEARRLQDEPLGVQPPQEREVREPYVVEAVKREFFSHPAFGETRSDRIHAMFTGGLHIHTTIDPRLQDIADEVIEAHFTDPEGPTAAIAAVEPGTGRVVALHSGAEFSEEQFDFASQGRRQPGSAFKTFVLAAALENGFPMGLSLEGSGPLRFQEPSWLEAWEVRNYANSSYGRLDLREALVRSVNTAFAQLIMAVGVEEVVDLATRLGLNGPRGIGTDIGPAIALGGLQYGVTPLEMASAFGALGNEGLLVRPHLIDRVLDTSGKQVFAASTEADQAVDPMVAAASVDVMQDVVRRGTATRARLSGWQVAGKTGTTQNNADAWFVGFVPVLSTAVWMGYPQGQIRMPGTTGGSLPARLWHEFMARALEDVEPVAFPDVRIDLSHLASSVGTAVPDVRRMDEGEALAALGAARLVAQVQRVDSLSPEGIVLWQSPSAGGTALPGQRVVIGVSTGQPPEEEEEEESEENGEEGEGAEADEPGEPGQADPTPAPESAPQPSPEPAPQPQIPPPSEEPAQQAPPDQESPAGG